ncbi:Hypothetical protein HDN1F_31510 [gamma proteobacterium HdN1]|nr:Hypothetical protein HDN1F_31510 [gamma proteobacterium HdN1]
MLSIVEIAARLKKRLSSSSWISMDRVSFVPVLSPDQRRRLQQLLGAAVISTENRMVELGIRADTLLDPEDSLDKQIALLRYYFLEGERAALRFEPSDHNYWRVIRAFLQPIVVAYQAHEQFARSQYEAALSGASGVQVVNGAPGGWMLDVSGRSSALDAEAVVHEGAGFSPVEPAPKVALRTANDMASIQGNVLTELSAQIKALEKREKNYQNDLLNKTSEASAACEMRDQALAKVAQLEQQLSSLRAELQAQAVASPDLAALVEQQAPLTVIVSEGQSAPNDTDPLDTKSLLDSGSLVVNTAPVEDAERSEWQQRVDALQAEVASMTGMAQQAYMSSSDMSIILLFMLSSFRVDSFDQLGGEILRTVSTYGLKPTVGVTGDSGQKFFKGPKSAEGSESLIESRSHRGPLVEEGRMLIIYEGRISLLVADMPVDQARRDHLRDNLSTLIKGAAARAEAIVAANAVERQKAQMERLLVKSDEVFTDAGKKLERQQMQMVKQVQLAVLDLRTRLQLNVTDSRTAAMVNRAKQLEDSLRELFRVDQILDVGFARSVARVANNIREKEQGA